MAVDEDAARVKIEERRKLRSDLLIAIYVATNGSPAPYGRVGLAQVAAEHGWNPQDLDQASFFLKEAGYLEFLTAGDVVCLTAHGIQAVEQALAPSDEDPLEPITSVEIRAVESFVSDLQGAVESGRLSGDPADVEELRTLVQALESQLHGRGRRRVVRAILHVVGGLLMGMGGNFATELAKQLPTLLR